jgi:hypothetical protein
MQNDNLPALMQQLAALRDALDVRMCLAGVEKSISPRGRWLWDGQPAVFPCPARARTDTSSPAPCAAAATEPGASATGGTGTRPLVLPPLCDVVS